MEKTYLIDFSNVFNWLANECKRRGLKMSEVIERSGAAKSTPVQWERKNPRSFDNLAAIDKAMSEIEAENKAIAKALEKLRK